MQFVVKVVRLTVMSVYRSLKGQRINGFRYNFRISLLNIIPGNTILPEMFEFWKVQLFLEVHVTCGIRTSSILPELLEFWKVQLFLGGM